MVWLAETLWIGSGIKLRLFAGDAMSSESTFQCLIYVLSRGCVQIVWIVELLCWFSLFRQDYSGYVPSDFPVGPWSSHEDVKDDIQKFCKDMNTGGGAWSVRWNGTPKPDAVRRLVCSNAHDLNLSRGTGSKPRQQNGTRCQWKVRLSARQTDGIHDWVVSGGFREHNHDLLSSRSGCVHVI